MLSRCEQASAQRLAQVRSDLERLTPRAKPTDVGQLVSLLTALAEGNPPAPPDRTAVEPAQGGPGPSRPAEGAPDHGVAHGFVACQFGLPAKVAGRELLGWLRSLPVTVLRAKGVVELQELPGRHFVFQRTDDAPLDPTVFPLGVEPTLSPCAVLIGAWRDAAKLKRQAYERLGAPEFDAT